MRNLKFFSAEIRNDIFDEEVIFGDFVDFWFQPENAENAENQEERPNVKFIQRPVDHKLAKISISLRKFEFSVIS
ncbi:unnamed protein product [Caenorhabditis nigoni]